MRKNLFLWSFALLIALFSNCKAQKGEENQAKPIMCVIFDTDIGNDIDDALALDMLYKYMDQGRMQVLAIMSNKDSRYSTEYIDIMNTWYGYPDIPIGKLEDGVIIDDYVNYAQNVCEFQVDGKPMFERTLEGYNNLLDAHMLYRKVLAEQPDTSVTIISVGFSTNLARLLETTPDEFSSLSGKDLVSQKVKLLSVMGGDFKENPRKEFNIVNDIPSAHKLFEEWPGEIVVSPFEVGRAVQFPATVIENDFNWGMNHPMVEGYKHYRPMPYDRATWDLTSVLYVTEPENYMMTLSEPGRITVSSDGFTHFEATPSGKHRYLSIDKEQATTMKQYFVELITSKPKNIK